MRSAAASRVAWPCVARRMAELFDLRGKRAAARGRLMPVDEPQRLIHERAYEAAPVDGRIAIGLARIEQIAVFDERQRTDDERRHLIKAAIREGWITRAEQRPASFVEQSQASLILFLIRHEEAEVGNRIHHCRVARLACDDIAACAQARFEVRQSAVAEANVVRTVRRGKADAVAWARFDRE